MKLVFFSLTGQTKRLVKKLDMTEQAIQLSPSQETFVEEDFILFCPTYEGGVDHVDDFLEDCGQFCLGIVGIGNRNFGPDFCHLAKRYAATYQFPLLYTLEFSGTPDDVATLKGMFSNES